MDETLEEGFAQPRLEAIEDAWRSACDDAVAAYRRWATAAAHDRADAYLAYVAAAEREAAAGDHLQAAWSLSAPAGVESMYLAAALAGP
ncbi:MAG TPA: hypothetical protein VH418_10565 [Solirubrobacteraceae bacterium]|jgi:hypothetical protein